MPAPTAADGAGRAIEEIAAPSALAIFAVIFALHFRGTIVAGLVLFTISVLGIIALASLAKYWNVPYTVGFVAFAIVALIMIPSILGELVHPAFAVLTNIVVLIGVIFISWLLVSKLNLNSTSYWR